MIRQLALAVLATLLLAACADEVPLPPAAPLAAPAEVIETLYGALPGPHAVNSARDIVLPGQDQQRDLSLNLYYPGTGNNFPLLLFSHGNWSDKDSYDVLLEHWASHGYAVIATDHLDCCSAVKGIFNSLRYGELGLIEARVEDLRRLVAELPSVEALHPPFKGKADPLQLAMTGHSFGAFTAQQFGGAAALDPDTGSYRSHFNPGVAAVVALSPPGPMFDAITADSWHELRTPTLVSTGTWDIQPGFWPDWKQHLMSWETGRPGDKYALVTEGADHYLGNLICRTQREAEPQEDALTMVRVATTAFLDAYLKGDQRARDFLDDNPLGRATGGFSSLQVR